MIRGLDHIVLSVREIAASVHFYCDVLGMQIQRLASGDLAARFGSQTIIFAPISAESNVAIFAAAELCLLVEGTLESWINRLQEYGLSPEGEPQVRHGSCGELLSIHVRDPDGNRIELAIDAKCVELQVADRAGIEFRLATASSDEAEACLEIYRPSVESSHHSFETQLPSVDAFQKRMRLALEGHTWWLAYRDGDLLGYAYSNAHREREAYRQACEVSAYVDQRAQRIGIASQLYARVFQDLQSRGKTVAYAIIALPHADSVAFHEKLGFRQFARFPQAGRKFDQAWDVGWWRRPLL